MSWDTEIVKHDAAPILCLEIVGENETFYYADTPLKEASAYWHDRIMSVGDVGRSLDISGGRMQVSDLLFILNNSTIDAESAGYFNDILSQNVMVLKEANVYLKFRDSSGAIQSEKIYSGNCIPEMLSAIEFHLSISHAILTGMGPLQRQISAAAFPNAPANSIGLGMPIVLGEPRDDGYGAVELIMVDDTTDAQEFLMASHPISGLERIFRLRSGSITELTRDVHYTMEYSLQDGLGKWYSSITLMSGQYQDEDKFYAHMWGIPTGDSSTYLEFNGSTYLFAAVEDSPNIPGRDGYLGGFSLRLGGGPSSANAVDVIGVWEESGNQRSWLAATNAAGRPVLYLSGDGTTVYSATADSHALAYYSPPGPMKCFTWVYFPGIGVRAFYGSTELPITESGVCPPTLFASTADLTIGKGVRSGDGNMGGHLFRVQISGTPQADPSDGDDPGNLDDIIAEYLLGPMTWSIDLVGQSDLSLGAGEIAGAVASTSINPAWIMDALLRWKLFGWHLSPEMVRRSSLYAASGVCIDRGYVDLLIGGTDFGGIIPERVGEIDNADDPWMLLQELCRNFDHYPIIDRAGRLGVVCLDLQDGDQTAGAILRQVDGDLDSAGFSVSLRPQQIINRARVQWGYAQRPDLAGVGRSYLDYAEIADPSSINRFGETQQEIFKYRFINFEEMAQDVSSRYLLMCSGGVKSVAWPIPGLWGLQDGCEIGSIVQIETNRGIGDWSLGKKCVVVGQHADLIGCKSALELLTTGDTLGPITWERGAALETPILIYPIWDLYVDSESSSTNYDTSNQLIHGYGPSEGSGQRIVLAFDLSALAGMTINSASLRFYVVDATSPVQRPDGTYGLAVAGLRDCAGTGSFADTMTWANANGGGAWDDSINLPNPYIEVDAQVMTPGEIKTLACNADGLTYLNGKVGSTAYLSFQAGHHMDPGESYTIASVEAVRVEWRPVLIINYV